MSDRMLLDLCYKTFRMKGSEAKLIIMSDNALLDLCVKAYHEKGSEASFKANEQWLNDNKDSREILKRAANFQGGNYNSTPLHELLGARPLRDLVERFIALAPNTLKVQDIHGYLPLQWACKCGASPDVIKMLVQRRK